MRGSYSRPWREFNKQRRAYARVQQKGRTFKKLEKERVQGQRREQSKSEKHWTEDKISLGKS